MIFFCDSFDFLIFWKKINKPQKIANMGMESKYKFKWCCKINMVLFDSYIIVIYLEVFLECMHTSIGNLVQHGKFDLKT